MSTNLYYEPAVERKEYLGKDLKRVIAPIIWGHDGSLGGSQEFVGKETTFWDEDKSEMINLYQFLTGLSHAKDSVGEEAKKTVELIDKYDGIFITLEG